MVKPYVIFSSLTEDKGHLILDDSFWFRNLSKIRETKIYSSSSSINNLKKQLKANNSTLFTFKTLPLLQKINYRFYLILKILFCKSISNSNIIIQGFDEICILFFFLKVNGKNNKIALVLTNNISPERLERSRFLLKFLLSKIFKKSDKVFYHSDFELSLILSLIPDKSLLPKYFKVKYHLLGMENKNLISNQNSNTISFFGPDLLSKPVSHFLDLILADKKNIYEYNFININEKSIDLIKEKISQNRKVKFINEYLPNDKYIRLIQTSKYVFLPHNYLYEGKLSGILSDCIANGIPIVSDKIEPVVELFSNYGSMGYIFDFNKDTNWYTFFLDTHNENEYADFISNMSRCRNAHREDVIINEFVRDFDLY